MGYQAIDVAKLADYPVTSMAVGPDGTLYVGTLGGGVHSVNPSGSSKRLVAEEKLMFSALAFGRGKLFAATSPDGDVRTIDEGTSRPFFNPGSKYIWALLSDRTSLLVATGEPGRVLRVSPEGRSKVALDPGETHVRALIHHPTRGIIAGGGQKGIVYQVGDAETFALYDSSMDEVTGFAVDRETGDLFAAFVTESKPGALVPERSIGPVKGDEDGDEEFPIKGSEVVRIAKDGQVTLLWNSKREGALALAFDPDRRLLYIATGTRRTGRGRLYAIDPKNRDRLLLMARVEAPVVSSVLMAPVGGSAILGTSPTGRVIRLGPGRRSEATYVSSEQDLARIAQIGRVWYEADLPVGTSVEVSIRSGNTREYDRTWTSWAEPTRAPDGSDVTLTPGRYVQLRAVLRAAPTGEAPTVKSLHASVMRKNVAPEVSEVFLLRRGVYMAAMPAEDEREKTITLNTSALRELRALAPDESRTRVRQNVRPGMMTVAWAASDPNQDGLLFEVELRPVDRPVEDGTRPKAARSPWLRLAEDLEYPFFSFDSRAYPDGKYEFRVRASDRPSNPPDQALTDENLSDPFLIDNEPPRIVSLSASRVSGERKMGERIRIEAVAIDSVSRISLAELAIDGSPWLMLPAKDGLVDAKRETFSVEVDPAAFATDATTPRPEWTVQIRVEDEAGNLAAASTSVATPPSGPRR